MDESDEFYHDAENHEEDEEPHDRPRSFHAIAGWLYDRAVSGIAGIESAETLAQRYYTDARGDVRLAVKNLIYWESIKAGSSGFLSGVGGVVALPVTLPLNITSVLFLQTRLVAAIASLGGHRLSDERIRALAGICLCGNAAKALLQDLALQALDRVSDSMLEHASQRAPAMLAARAGVVTCQSMARLLPLAGGIVSGAVDVTSTRTIGHIARSTFLTTSARVPCQQC